MKGADMGILCKYLPGVPHMMSVGGYAGLSLIGESLDVSRECLTPNAEAVKKGNQCSILGHGY
ncbi:hypothetical protein [Methylovirgula sp. 4M-Z18]|uniref:hypothetical protein n=1 Tax=Methylovirgula sp. 4M-Z18 TaxID=2293567 RepID=UPI0011C04405|nr:hypothetical protein [Methylovirgula sp. 4M-Z18]